MSAPYGLPYPMIPPLPSKETHRTQPGDQWSTLSPEQSTNVAQEQALTQQKLEDIAGPERQLIDQQAAIHAEAARAKAAGMEQQARERERRDQETAADLSLYKNRLEGAYKNAQSAPAASLFADGTTGEKVMRGVGLAMAGLGDAIRDAGAARMGRGPGPSTFMNLIEMDLQRQREHIAKLKDEVLMARTGVQDATKAREVALAEVDAKGAGFMKRIEGWMNARMDALKDTPLAKDVAQSQALAAAKQAGLDYQQRSFAGLERKHAGQTVENIERDNTSNMPKPPTPGSDDVKEANRLASDIQIAKDAIKLIEKDPRAWDEYRNNSESWQRSQAAGNTTVLKEVRAAGQVAGLADVAPEQGLKSPTGKQLHQFMTQIKMGVAKGYGGVVTEHDVNNAGSELADLAQSPKERIQGLGRVVDKMQANLDAYYANRGVLPRPGTAGPGPAPSGPAPSLVPQQPGAKQVIPPATPSTAAPSNRDRYLQILRDNPGLRGTQDGKDAMRAYHITDKDLR